jgi:hypothetical protein
LVGVQEIVMACEMKPWLCHPAMLMGSSWKPKEVFMKIKRNAWLVAVSMALSVAGYSVCQAASAVVEELKHEQAALSKALAQSKLGLIEGIQQSTKTGEVAISAKFELDDAGKLSLSIYTAENGLNIGSEHNVLKELSGSPVQDKWNPAAEVFKDIPHIKRSSEQLTLMRLSPFTLIDILAKVQKTHRGVVFSITPAIQGNKPVFVVLKDAGGGKVTELDYSLLNGSLLTASK